jgi:hypothetical protein
MLLVAVLVFWPGFFPRATKHLWYLAVQQRVRPGNEAEWFRVPEDDLPRRSFSVQTLSLLGVLPLATCFMIGISCGVKLRPSSGKDFADIFIAVYAAQFVVLHHMKKVALGYSYYLYREKRPLNFVNRRMLGSTFVAFVIPAFLGVLYSAGIHWLASIENPCCRILGILWILFAVPLPFCCDQSLVPLAIRHKWISERDWPQLYRAPASQWRICVAVIFFDLVLLLLIYL